MTVDNEDIHKGSKELLKWSAISLAVSVAAGAAAREVERIDREGECNTELRHESEGKTKGYTADQLEKVQYPGLDLVRLPFSRPNGPPIHPALRPEVRAEVAANWYLDHNYVNVNGQLGPVECLYPPMAKEVWEFKNIFVRKARQMGLTGAKVWNMIGEPSKLKREYKVYKDKLDAEAESGRKWKKLSDTEKLYAVRNFGVETARRDLKKLKRVDPSSTKAKIIYDKYLDVDKNHSIEFLRGYWKGLVDHSRKFTIDDTEQEPSRVSNTITALDEGVVSDELHRAYRETIGRDFDTENPIVQKGCLEIDWVILDGNKKWVIRKEEGLKRLKSPIELHFHDPTRDISGYIWTRWEILAKEKERIEKREIEMARARKERAVREKMRTLSCNVIAAEKYGPVLKIETQEDADIYFDALVEHDMGCTGNRRGEAEKIERELLGYYAGYQDLETDKRVQKLFRCSHPIFGPADRVARTFPPEAFEKRLKEVYTEIQKPEELLLNK